MDLLLSKMIMTVDNHIKLVIIVTHLTDHQLPLSINVVNNRKIDVKSFVANGLGLNFYGANGVAKSFKNRGIYNYSIKQS